MTIFDLLGLAPGGDADLPPPDASDRVLVRWLEARLGRPPAWFEVLELRRLLRALAWRRARWRWWRRLRPLQLPGLENLAADFLATAEGQHLLRLLGGSIAALVTRLELPEPFKGFDGAHPTAVRPTRLERLRERIASGAPVPLWAQASAVSAYATWKVTGVPVLAPDLMPEMVEFLAPTHAAAVNAMSPSAAMEFARRLGAARCSDAGRRAILAELERIGAEAITRWPEIIRRTNVRPLDLWPIAELEELDGQGVPSQAFTPSPNPTALR